MEHKNTASTEKATTDKANATTQEQDEFKNLIPGRDLKIMRIAAGKTTAQMASEVGVKSRKTIENWESSLSTPSINQWMQYCFLTGHNPAAVIIETQKRNAEDPTKKLDIDLKACKQL